MFKNLKDKLIKRKGLLFYAIGFLALLWLIFRSGANPKRLAYPCQQAAFPLASAFVVSVGGSMAIEKMREQSKHIAISLSIAVGLVIAYDIAINTDIIWPKTYDVAAYPVWTSSNPTSKIYLYDNITYTSPTLEAGDASVSNSSLDDPAVDSIINYMETRGDYFYKTVAHPTGIVNDSDVVVIKVNLQWRNRMSTNTDRVKGVIWAILNHPDGFNGEILVCDNGSKQDQNQSYFCGFTAYANNSDDTDQDILNVVDVFQAKGYKVDTLEWDRLNDNVVSEYSANDMDDGYLYNSTTKVNYPKFQTPEGNYVSLKYGIWNNTTDEYEDRLTIINMPVVKAHGIGGATIAIKNWIGTMNQTQSTSWYGGDVDATFHPNYIFNSYALVARQIDETYPDLTIVDATWTAPTNNYNYAQTSIKTETILASRDVLAADWYAAKYILTPIADEPTYTDPELNNTHYGTNLGYWADYLQNTANRDITMDSTKITVYASALRQARKYRTAWGVYVFGNNIRKVLQFE